MRLLLGILSLVTGLVACGTRPSPAPASSAAVGLEPAPSAATTVSLRVGDPAHGRALVAKFECHRCHEGTGLDELPSERHCVRCHQDIEAGKVSAAPERLARWKRGLTGVSHAPTLSSLSRFEPRWVERYLVSPRDSRPALVSTMPRLDITAEQARDVASYLSATRPLPAPAKIRRGDVAGGRRVAESRGCASCHAFSGVSDWPRARSAGAAVELAPDLVHARERLSREMLAAWLENPAALKPDTAMPDLALTEAERADESPTQRSTRASSRSPVGTVTRIAR